MNTNNTSVMGAALGAAVGCVVAYVAETAMAIDIPAYVEGAVVVIATAVTGRFYPPDQS